MAILAPDLVTDFTDNGFVVTPDLLSSEDLRTFGAAVDRAVANRTVDDARAVEDKSIYEQSFVQCMRLWETNPDVAPLTFHRRLAEAAAQLLGVDEVLLWQDQALYKEPGGRLTDPHQDAPFWPVGEAPMITAWIPFDGSSVAQGGMGYVPGSHLAGRLTAVDLLHRSEPYDIMNDPALGGAEPVFVEVPAGSVVWHHGLTVHQAMPNTTDETRRVFTIVYLAAGHRRAEPWQNFPLDRAGVAAGEIMAGEGLPVAWPRPDGPPPDPPVVLGEPTGPQRTVQPTGAGPDNTVQPTGAGPDSTVQPTGAGPDSTLQS
jgi:ectoine hydroxylase-related dioxygenase (phytanoyl-CoA dioxygenase family)